MIFSRLISTVYAPCPAKHLALARPMATLILALFVLSSAGCLSPITRRLDITNTRVGETNEKLRVTNAGVGKANEKLSVMNRNSTGTNQRLDQVNAQLANVRAKLDGTNRKLDTLLEKIERVPGLGGGQHERNAGR